MIEEAEVSNELDDFSGWTCSGIVGRLGFLFDRVDADGTRYQARSNAGEDPPMITEVLVKAPPGRPLRDGMVRDLKLGKLEKLLGAELDRAKVIHTRGTEPTGHVQQRSLLEWGGLSRLAPRRSRGRPKRTPEETAEVARRIAMGELLYSRSQQAKLLKDAEKPR